MLQNVNICTTARNEKGLLIGICFGITDFTYFLFLTDLGVDREYTRQGIGSQLVIITHEQAGGKEDINIISWANKNALVFYESCGMKTIPTAVAKDATDSDFFTVTESDLNH